jgi:hypothetical protein
MRTERFFLSVLTVAALFAIGPRADAFCRTSTNGLRDGCTIGGTECCTIGKPLFWKNACVGYSLQKDASRQVSYDDAAAGVATAFAKWTGTSCPTDGTGTSLVSIGVRDLGPVTCGAVEYNKDGPNQHVIAFRDDTWTHMDSNNTLALTTVTFSPDTGEIFDADMEVNTAQQHLTVKDPIPADGFDFGSIITHETGHFLGLAHSTDASATMFAHYKQGATAMRNLKGDDVSGICAIYPPNGTRNVDTGSVPEDVCDPTPRHGFTKDCGAPATTKGCQVGLVGGLRGDETRGPGSAHFAIGALGALGLARASRRRTPPRR